MNIRVLHIGPKNFPPAHGGVEKSIFDLAHGLRGVSSFVAVEWKHSGSSNVLQLPSGLVGRIRAIARFARANEIDVLHFNKEGFIPLALWFYAFTSKAVVLTVRGCAWRLKKWSAPIRCALYLLDICACLVLPKVVFVGRRDFDHFSRVVPWRTFHFIPNGVVDHEFKAKGAAGDFVYVGRISAEKNVLRLVEWFDKTKARLTIYGPIDERSSEYGRQVIDAIGGCPTVSYGGVLAHTELFQTLSKHGAFINPSFSEGMPVSVLEAASVGLTLVLSDIRQHRDLGFPDAVYVSPDAITVEGLARVGGFSEENARMTKESYSLRNTCERYEALYDQLLGGAS